VKKPNVNVVAFDCSTQACSAAVRVDGRIVAYRSVDLERGQAEVLMPMVMSVLADAGLRWADVHLIGVTVGPGTFTGLRIGLAAARGMALAGGLPVAGVTTTETVAMAVPQDERRGRTVLATIDGKRADLFVQAFAEDLSPLGSPFAMMPDEAPRLFPGPLALAGGGVARLRAVLPEALIASSASVPDARVVAELAERRFAAGQALAPEPLYLRPPDVTLPGGPP
jgi:tRNA threonylcarbamoyladenosine biosynthesis protein TsaB